MSKNMTPSAEQKMVTEAQIGKAVANYRALLEKHSVKFGLEPFQIVLGQSELAEEQFGVLRRRVEMFSNMITRCIKVDRKRTPQAVLDATNRKQYTASNVVSGMPKGEGEEVEVVFFKLGRWISDIDLDKEYELRGLKPADPYSLSAVNEADSAFADEKPNGTHWKDTEDKWCFATFNRWSDDERNVSVYRLDDDHDWYGDWWFAGLRK